MESCAPASVVSRRRSPPSGVIEAFQRQPGVVVRGYPIGGTVHLGGAVGSFRRSRVFVRKSLRLAAVVVPLASHYVALSEVAILIRLVEGRSCLPDTE